MEVVLSTRRTLSSFYDFFRFLNDFFEYFDKIMLFLSFKMDLKLQVLKTQKKSQKVYGT